MKTYDNRIILYLDILAFKRLIKDTIVDKQINHEKIEELHETLELVKNTISKIKEDGSAVITQFSDLIVVSFHIDDTNKVIPFFESIMALNMLLINRGILCRGTIAYGSLLHTKDFIFGPALIEAYETETSAAIYPRIILDKSVLDIIDAKYFEKLPHRNSKFPKELPIKYKLFVKHPLKIDTDDKYYFDYFGWSTVEYDNDDLMQYLLNLRNLILRMESENKNHNPSIQIKYGWMKNKFNNFIHEFSERIYTDEEMFNLQKKIQIKILKID